MTTHSHHYHCIPRDLTDSHARVPPRPPGPATLSHPHRRLCLSKPSCLLHEILLHTDRDSDKPSRLSVQSVRVTGQGFVSEVTLTQRIRMSRYYCKAGPHQRALTQPPSVRTQQSIFSLVAVYAAEVRRVRVCGCRRAGGRREWVARHGRRVVAGRFAACLAMRRGRQRAKATSCGRCRTHQVPCLRSDRMSYAELPPRPLVRHPARQVINIY